MLGSIGNNGFSPLESVGPVLPVAPTSTDQTTDSIGKSSSAKEQKKVAADSPELQLAQYILWFGNNNQALIQAYGSNQSDTIGTVEQTGNINFEQLKLKFENDLHAIAIKMLDAWGKSIKEENEEAKRLEKSDRVREEEARKFLAGYEAFLQTLSSDERNNMIVFNRLTNIADVAGTQGQSLNDYLSKVSAEGSSIPSISGVAMTIMTQKTPMDGSSILDTVSPGYSVDLASFGNLFVNVASNAATVGTILSPSPPTQKIDYEFAKNYAQQILKELSRSDFNNWAMALVIHTMDKTEGVDVNEAQSLVVKLKLTMLSTALALLYRTETGGMTGKEFMSLVKGEMLVAAEDPKTAILIQIRRLSQELSQENQVLFLMAASSWVDESSKTEHLMKVSPLFRAMQSTLPSAASFSV